MTTIQEKELDILKEIIKVIEKNKLYYCAIGGTCLGAVRHHGFIPWDDDIDIAMPRRDYELFRTTLYKELPEHLKKLDCDNSKRNGYLFTKIYDRTTTFVENYAKDSPDRYTGVFVDIMPMDGLPAGRKGKRILKQTAFYAFINSLCRPVPMDYVKEKGCLKYIVRECLHILFRYNYFSDKILELNSRNEWGELPYVYFTWRRYKSLGTYKCYFKKEYFELCSDMQFEDINIRVPYDYRAYLSEDFGNDYMQLPPENQRVSIHNVVICDLETPCEVYAKRRQEGKL